MVFFRRNLKKTNELEIEIDKRVVYDPSLAIPKIAKLIESGKKPLDLRLVFGRVQDAQNWLTGYRESVSKHKHSAYNYTLQKIPVYDLMELISRLGYDAFLGEEERRDTIKLFLYPILTKRFI